GYAAYRTSSSPDPLGIRQEVKYALISAIFVVLPGIVLHFLDPGNYEKQNSISWEITLVLCCFLVFTFQAPLQVIQSKQWNRYVQNSNFTLMYILLNPVSKNMFYQHLKLELSEENLRF